MMLDEMREAISRFEPRPTARDGMARAAVLIAVYQPDDSPCILFQVRTELVLHHKGQISFPGGAEDPGDTDLLMTALRETEEEIGLQREDVDVWGQLDDLITISDFVVTPYVGRVNKPGRYPFAPSGFEVAELLEVPLSHLSEPSNTNDGPAVWRGQPVPPPSYSYGKHLIWGATARLLRQFLSTAAANG
jgi:8-oxo-dGTP pyrophosphatase MutT (NUDIX family)